MSNETLILRRMQYIFYVTFNIIYNIAFNVVFIYFDQH